MQHPFGIDFGGTGINVQTLSPAITSAGTIYLQWGTDWDIGIDNITYSVALDTPDVAPIPLPATAFLLVGALGGLGLMRRRKAA